MNKLVMSSIPSELQSYAGYEVTKELGRGGMGVVYLAKNVQLDRLEVLKVLNERLLDHEGAKERFLREVRAVSKLNHPNIVTSYSILPLGSLMVFAMEYVNGVDLHKFIRQSNTIAIGQACYFARQIAAGLQHAHEKNLVHRDIKPSNVMVYKSDGLLQLKILDFGLAKASSEEVAMTAGLTQDGTMLGTPEYMSPEQTLNAAKADIRVDIYSLGCTLYHMLTGKPPFTGTHGAVLMAHAQREAIPLNLVRPEIPPELAAVVAKMIAKPLEKRYQTPSEAASAIEPFLTRKTSSNCASIQVAQVPQSNTVGELNSPEIDTATVESSVTPLPSHSNEPIPKQNKLAWKFGVGVCLLLSLAMLATSVFNSSTLPIAPETPDVEDAKDPSAIQSPEVADRLPAGSFWSGTGVFTKGLRPVNLDKELEWSLEIKERKRKRFTGNVTFVSFAGGRSTVTLDIKGEVTSHAPLECKFETAAEKARHHHTYTAKMDDSGKLIARFAGTSGPGANVAGRVEFVRKK